VERIEAVIAICLDLSYQNECVPHQDSGERDQAKDGIEAERLMKIRRMGTTPTKPKGAVRTVMARADSERTWKNDDHQHADNHDRDHRRERCFALALFKADRRSPMELAVIV